MDEREKSGSWGTLEAGLLVDLDEIGEEDGEALPGDAPEHHEQVLLCFVCSPFY